MSHSNTQAAPRKFTATDAGPRQLKKAKDALSRFSWRAKTVRELSGVDAPGQWHAAEVTPMMGEWSDCARDAWQALGEAHAWTISKANAAALAKAAQAAAAALVLPEIDQRRSAAEESERLDRMAAADAKREREASDRARQQTQHVAELRAAYPSAVGADSGLSTHARAAKNLKAELSAAFPGVRFSVRSDCFAGGDSVDYSWTDGPTAAQVEPIAEKYKGASFDGMQDLKTLDGSAYGRAVEEVLGRADYVHGSREVSPQHRAAAARALCETQRVDPDAVQYRGLLGEDDDRSLGDHVHQLLCKSELPAGAVIVGVEYDNLTAASPSPWRVVLDTPAPSATPGQPGESCEVQQHHHTKRGRDFWLVVLADKVGRERFEALRDDCRAAGGWYSRKWGKCPGGFGFDSQAAAEAFADSINSTPGDAGAASGVTPAGAGPVEPNLKRAAQLRKLADGLQVKIDAGRAPLTQNRTPKREREYLTRVAEADNLERGQQALRALADAHDAGEVPSGLQHLRHKWEVLPMVAKRIECGTHGHYSVTPTDEYRRDDDASRALQAMIAGQDADAVKAAERRTAEAKLSGISIPGFFPTPAAVVARMIEAADLQAGQMILEPSAGKGDIADAVEQSLGRPYGNLDCVELNPQLAEFLSERYAVMPQDFLALDPATHYAYDRVLMNPPYEKGAAWRHLQHALTMLRPGGRVVCLVPDGGDQRTQEELAQLPPGFEVIKDEPLGQAFKGAAAFRSTAVAVRLVVVGREEQPSGDESPAGPLGLYQGDDEAEELTGAVNEARRRPAVASVTRLALPEGPTVAAVPVANCTPQQWAAKVWATNGKDLIGGKRLALFNDDSAEACAGYLTAALELNQAAGIQCDGEIVPVFD